MNAPWLFAEAYKYRRLQECFSVSKFWKNYDVFFRQKVRPPATPQPLTVLTFGHSAIRSPDRAKPSSSSPCDLLSRLL